ncbi:GNAT family N-acetyltransferase [Glutamicibacter halophytocola]|uniref:GNAT family N-acetyltransferase n=1 Tax=Glutamicibacter halophytocola TaxID=1933880 RepID=A0AA94XPX2_9MICC|nr:GNAT family N-acetyltransferase [Glutamicibacter halophytocola]UUX57859.1 GNAT family N-acetyltransferase [Glutamicibacter halophytocola]
MTLSAALEFRELASQDEQQAIDAHRAMLADDFEFLPTWSADELWENYTYRMSAGRRGEHIPQGWVRSALFGAFDDGELVGRVSVRYELNDFLLQNGGHIGYGVLSEHRRRGLATALCQFGLREVQEAGVLSALVTCEGTNLGSIATILKCGGVPDSQVPYLEAADGSKTLRYWISTQSTP